MIWYCISSFGSCVPCITRGKSWYIASLSAELRRLHNSLYKPTIPTIHQTLQNRNKADYFLGNRYRPFIYGQPVYMKSHIFWLRHIGRMAKRPILNWDMRDTTGTSIRVKAFIQPAHCGSNNDVKWRWNNDRKTSSTQISIHYSC